MSSSLSVSPFFLEVSHDPFDVDRPQGRASATRGPAAVQLEDAGPQETAWAAADAVRALNRQTLARGDGGGFRLPSDVDAVLGALQTLAERLPQALAQAAAWLQDQYDAGAVGHDEDPELYARARQSYPPALFATLDQLAGPLTGADVVEIGPGTGQATVGLVAAGARVTAVEPGQGMARSAAETPPITDEIDTSELFAPAVRGRVEQDVDYTAEEYLLLLSSYSGHRALSPERRAGLFADVRALIDDRYAGTVTKRFLYEVRVARRLGDDLA